MLLAATLVSCLPILRNLENWGIQDWDQHTFHHAVPRETLLEYRQMPLWNPYNDGGVPMLANPESRVLAPGFLLTLVFGEVVGPKLEIPLHQLLGMLGAALLLSSFGIGAAGSLAGGLVFALNTWFSIHLAVGHIWALNLAYVPWALWCQRRSVDSPVYAIPTALLLVLMFFGGGVYPIVVTLILMLLFAGVRVLQEPRLALRQGMSLALVAAIAPPLAAVKLLPSAEHLARHPRATAVEGGYTPGALANALLDRDQSLRAAFAERRQEFTANRLHHGLYMGVAPLLLVAMGLVWRTRRALPLLCIALLPLWMALGTQVAPSLWAALHALPVLGNLRMPQRFGIAAVLPLCVVLGLGVDALLRRLPRRGPRALLVGGIVGWLALDPALVSRRVFAEAFPITPPSIQRGEHFRQQRRNQPYDARGPTRYWGTFTTSSGLYPNFLANLGSVVGYQVVPVPRHAIPYGAPGYRGEVYLDGSEGRAQITGWSPNRVDVALRVETPDTLVLNQNFDPGWRVAAEPAREVVSTRGLVSMPVAPGDEQVSFYYRPASFVIGAWTSGLSLAALAPLAIWLRRHPRASS